jgi:phosphoglycerol transferase MdoB-like AlkP superfamily enzyme
VVYQQYIGETPTSLVSTLKNEGYTCVAMHPYYATGWSRNAVYPDLGFDEMHFIDDFDETNVLREYITDRELYEKIIDRFESRGKNEDMFLMSISMQNHGGYTEKYDNFTEKVRLLGLDYPDVNQYLSLLYESDSSLEYLITYFENVDDPVEIVFFGDHQPSLSSSFYPNLNGKGLSGLTEDELEALYTIPFFIWTNYDSPEETVDITSINYLSNYALERAGIDLPPYNQFLSDMAEVVPAINSRGYYSKESGSYKHLEDATGDEAEWIANYNILQYNGMFDKKKRSSVFFPYQ